MLKCSLATATLKRVSYAGWLMLPPFQGQFCQVTIREKADWKESYVVCWAPAPTPLQCPYSVHWGGLQTLMFHQVTTNGFLGIRVTQPLVSLSGVCCCLPQPYFLLKRLLRIYCLPSTREGKLDPAHTRPQVAFNLWTSVGQSPWIIFTIRDLFLIASYMVGWREEKIFRFDNCIVENNYQRVCLIFPTNWIKDGVLVSFSLLWHTWGRLFYEENMFWLIFLKVKIKEPHLPMAALLTESCNVTGHHMAKESMHAWVYVVFSS